MFSVIYLTDFYFVIIYAVNLIIYINNKGGI